MKINKFTSALIALGVISAGSLAQANTTVYLTGSTAARAIIYAAATTAGQIFSNGSTSDVIASGGAPGSGDNYIVYEGNIAGVGTVDLNCSFTGSEAGIAAVSGQTLTQNVNGGTYALPGVPPSFLNPNNSYATTNTLAQIGGSAPANPDLTMADTSQAVSQTSATTYPLVDYGVVGIVPFTFLKGYNSNPTGSDQAWADFHNVTTAAFNQNLSAGDLYNANNYTGVAADASEGVAIVGRNLGSGTRVNTLLSAQYGITTPVKQQGFDSTYPSGTPGVLTFGKNYSSGQVIQSYGNDGFDGGSSVQAELNVDGHGCGDVVIGYLGVSDGQNAVNPAKAGVSTQLAVALTYNGVYESDAGVINGSYTFWGQEHLLGSVGQSSTQPPGETAAAIVSGIAAQLSSGHYGTATGDFSTLGAGPGGSGSGALGQSIIIPKSLMQVHRTTDVGFPVQGNH